MGGFSVDGRNERLVESAEEMFGKFCAEVVMDLGGWTASLRENPDSLETLEAEVHKVFARGADLLVVGLMAVAIKGSEFQDATERTREQHPNGLNRGRSRPVRIRLLGGLVVWMLSLYCLPRRPQATGGKTSGVHVEMLQFGIDSQATPGLQSRVARKVALLPSIAAAHAELEREGVHLDRKTVRRLTYACGNNLLLLRKDWLGQWRAGQMPAGTELAGKRVAVQIDGGRVKVRGKLEEKPQSRDERNADGLATGSKPGRSKTKSRKTYSTDWREPKLVTIYEHDRNGKMIPGTKATIDGTLHGPDAICELTAMHLHRLGAASALSITFANDGAPWIWDRIGSIVEHAGLEDVTVYEVLDNCHANHHISLALAAMELPAEDRQTLYRHYRTLLRNGQWRQIVDELTDFDELDLDSNPKLATEVNYLRKHGEAGRLKYTYFKRVGVPLGSGSIESAIRRVVNMRLKSNATFWCAENAEAVLQVRASVVSDRWDAQRTSAKKLMHSLASTDWTWTPVNMSHKKAETIDATAT